jgi:hypothetical protein
MFAPPLSRHRSLLSRWPDIAWLLLLWSAPLSAADHLAKVDEYRAGFLARCAEVRTTAAGRSWDGRDSRERIYLGVVKLATDTDVETGLRYLVEGVDDPRRWGSFETYAYMDAVLRLGDELPADLVERIRDRLAAAFGHDLGFTDNHWLQYQTARYLFADRWPDGPRFADGSTPAEGQRDAAAWMERWIRNTVTQGMYEYDSPNYHHLYLLCFATVHEFTHDERLRRLAWMIVQVLLADWATEYLEGHWVGSHSREKYNQVLHTHEHTGAATQFGRLYFGGAPLRLDLAESYYISLAALQEFAALPIIGAMALDRTRPYVLRELKAPRRGPGIAHGEPTWKYTYLTPRYALGSSWGDLTDVEHHRWDLTWLSPHDGSTCFFINPSYSAGQLHRYFREPLDAILPEIVRQRPYYADPHKWVEGSPHEDLWQHENALIALYDLPADAGRSHINGFFPHFIAERHEEDGWIFCRTDGIIFAIWTSVPGTWHPQDGHDRFTLEAPRVAVVMEVLADDSGLDWEAFRASRLAHPPTFDPRTMTASYLSTRGAQLTFTHHGARAVNGQNADLANWPLFEGPWLNARAGEGVVSLRHGSEEVRLDFNQVTVQTKLR